MRVERQRVTDLLRSRGNAKTAELAARSLPATIDLARDRIPPPAVWDRSQRDCPRSQSRGSERIGTCAQPNRRTVVRDLGMILSAPPAVWRRNEGSAFNSAEAPAMGTDPKRDPRGRHA